MSILQFDLTRYLKGKSDALGPGIATGFALCVGLNILSYLLFICHYFLTNRAGRFPWISPNDQLFAGRWFAIFFYSLTGFANTPALQQIMGILLHCLAAFCLALLWQRQTERRSQILVVTLVATLYPANLAAFYYTWQVGVFFGAILLVVLGLMVADSFRFFRFALGSLCITLGLATYQPSLSVAATILMACIVLEIIYSPPGTLFISLWRRQIPRLLALLAGGFGYLLSLRILGLEVNSVHSLKIVTLSELPVRIQQVVVESFLSLVYTQPDIRTVLRTLLLVASGLAMAELFSTLLRRYKGRELIMRLVLLTLASLGLVIATKALFLISNNNYFWQYRYNFSLSYFFAFIFFILSSWRKPPLFRSSILVLCCATIFLFMQSDLLRQGVLLRGQEHDLALANRMLQRIEQLPELDLSKEYYCVRTGPYPPIRMNMMHSSNKFFGRGGDHHMDHGEITDVWNPAYVFTYLGSKIRWAKGGHYMPDFSEKMREAKRIAKAQHRKPWPHNSSIFIHNDWIIIYM